MVQLRSPFSAKGSPYSITERRVPELIPVLGSQPAGDESHKPGGRLPLLSARPAVMGLLQLRYEHDSSTIRLRFDYDSTTIRLQHATTRYEVFRALAYEIVYENQW